MSNIGKRLFARAIISSILIALIFTLSRCTPNHNKNYPVSSAPEHVYYDIVVPPETEQTENNLDIKIPNPQIMEVPDEEEMLFILDEDVSPIEDFNTEEYNLIVENDFKNVWNEPLSTFSIDVDKASYSNIRRYLSYHQMPPKDAVRLEEMINYFTYDYPQPEGQHPFSVTTAIKECAWNNENKLVQIGIQGKALNYDEIQPGNYVFLIDVSGSMDEPDKLPLVKKSMNIMLENLHPDDKIAIVVYAGAAGVVLPSTSVKDKEIIKKAINKLSAGGSTAGGEGIQLAYKIASENLIAGGNNRIILATDGDFNIGVSSTSELVRLVEEKRKEGIFLTICGYGMGNYKDGRLEEISAAGNGVYFYIDHITEAEKVFSRDLRANLFTIAKDVKIQVEFNPLKVHSYRLIGYENRMMNRDDFDNDEKDAGELGAGHSVTALYEIVPANDQNLKASNLRYQTPEASTKASSEEWMTLKLRYKPIDKEESILIENQLFYSNETGSCSMLFAEAVAGFGMLLRDSKYKGDLTYDKLIATLKEIENNEDQEKWELIKLVETASLLSNQN